MFMPRHSNAAAFCREVLFRQLKHISMTLLVLALALSAKPCFAIQLVMDYTYDSFFAAHPTAKASLEAAAQDISNAITTSLGPTVDSNSTTVHGTTVTFDFNFSYAQPASDATQTFDPAILPANQVRIFVGLRNISSGTTIGMGGPGGFGYQVPSFSYSDPNDVSTAVHADEIAANANMGRGGGPIIGHLSGDLGLSNTSYTINFGSSVGNLWFDSDTNNDGVTDADATLNSFWQFDHTAPVGGKNDFYSVALHELIHSLGFGTSQSWNALVSSPHNWLGPQVASLLGSGANTLGPDNDHVAEGLLSTRLSDGLAQEAVMDPALTQGTRKTLTRLDLAFLRDIGWQTIPYPYLPGDFNFDNRRTAADIQAMLNALTDLNEFKSVHSLSNTDLLTIADLNGDHAVTNADIQRLLDMAAAEGGAGSFQAVAEPGGFAVMACGALIVCCCELSRWRNRHAA
jgi:hypothetical protein